MHSLEQSVILEYKNPVLILFKQSISYKLLFIFILMILLASAYDTIKSSQCNCSSLFAGLIIIFFVWLFLITIISIMLIPAYYSFNKYKKLIISNENIYINNQKYDISNLEFKAEHKYMYRYPLAWTYLIISKNDRVIGKFIFEINSYNFFGMNSATILNVLNSIKAKKKLDYQKLIYTSILNEYNSNKEDSNNFKIVGIFILTPIFFMFLVLFLNMK